MTMAINTAEAAFFNETDFAEKATWTVAATSDNYVVIGVFNNDYYPAFEEYNAPVSSSSPTFTMLTSKIPTGALVDDTLTIPVNTVDTAYTIKVIERDGTGVSLLRLQKV